LTIFGELFWSAKSILSENQLVNLKGLNYAMGYQENQHARQTLWRALFMKTFELDL
jgi:hypothetical protein